MSADALPIAPERFSAALKDLSVGSLHLKVLELRNSIAHLDYSNEQLRPFAEGRPTSATTTTAQATEQEGGGASAAAAGAALGSEPQSAPEAPCEPDPVCAEAIRENELVIGCMEERIRLVRAEVEARGIGWTEFQSKEEEEEEEEEEGEGKGEEPGAAAAAVWGGRNGLSSPSGATTNGLVNGQHGGGRRDEDAQAGSAQQRQDPPHSAWTDGTFQTGVIRPGPGGEVRMDVNGDGGAGRGAGGGGGGGGGTLTDQELRQRMEERLRSLGINDDGHSGEGEGGLHL